MLTITQAIDLAGPEIFGSDWIGRLDQKQIELLKAFGPQRIPGVGEVIRPCPPDKVRDLDRALGRHHRIGVQRATVLDWISGAGVLIDARYRCDQSALLRALSARRDVAPGRNGKAQARGRGRPAGKQLLVITRMLVDLESGRRTPDMLRQEKQKILQADYGAAAATCNEARKVALAEWENRHQ